MLCPRRGVRFKPSHLIANLRMKKYVAFLRAINVAGHTIVRMSDLRDAFEAVGCRDARTYIQSGNVIFESPEKDSDAIFHKIRVKLRDLFGCEPGILFRNVRDLEGLVRAAPFRDFHAEPGIKLYVAFLAERTRTRPRFPLVSAKEGLEAIGMKGLDLRFGAPGGILKYRFTIGCVMICLSGGCLAKRRPTIDRSFTSS
jgi:uncharacterized protein (DUF1697 family)